MARIRFIKKKEPKGPRFTDASAVQYIAARLIGKYHTHLAEAKIAYRFRHGTWKLNGRTIFGKATKISGLNKELSGYDFAITINADYWHTMKPEIQEALVDHELSHCGAGIEDADGNPKWIIYPHDTEDFVSVIRRHGLWTPELSKLAKAASEHDQQLKLINLDEVRGQSQQAAND